MGLAPGCVEAFPEPTPVESKARGLLEEMAKAYKALPAYSDQGQFGLTLTVEGKVQKQSMPLSLTFVRPNRMDLKTDPVRVVSDGKTITTTVSPLKKFMAIPAPGAITPGTFREGPVGAVLFGSTAGPPMHILVSMLVADDPVKEILKLGGTLKSEDDRDVAGTACQALLIDQEQGADYRLLVDSKTKLLKGVEVVVDAEAMMKGAPVKQKIEISQFGWYPGTITTKEPGRDAFAYQPPEGFTKVETFATKAEEQEGLAEKMIGKPAPDFTLMVYDGPGKTKTLSKADLAGKVVMIDFWATWCGPCMIELPEVQKMIEAYADRDKDVLIVALSQDSKPTEPAAVRKLIEETLEAKKITLTGSPVGIIGHDPDGTVGSAFNVTGLPTVVILDGKGVVQSVHVGYNENVRKVLTSDIDTLLAGKSIARPAPVEAAEGSKSKEEVKGEPK